MELDLPELPPVEGTSIVKRVFKDMCNHAKERELDCEVVVCIQNYVYKRRIRVREFIEGFDLLHTGTVTINQFERALSSMGIGKYLTQREFALLCNRYMDPVDTNRIMWRIFEDEIDRGKITILLIILIN